MIAWSDISGEILTQFVVFSTGTCLFHQSSTLQGLSFSSSSCQSSLSGVIIPSLVRHELIIEAGRSEGEYWRDLFRYRELFYFLAWRDVLVRYKQTVIGVLWAIIRPFLTMVVFVFVFSRIAKLPSDGVPYQVMVFAALLPWQLFEISLSKGSNSLISNSNLISKIYFPRLIIQASSVIVSFVDFSMSASLLSFLMLWYHFLLGLHLLALL